jgi:hypothetical protein
VIEDLPHSIPQQDWVARYEQLRSAALSRGQGISTGFGLTLFLRHGMVAWMRACSCGVTPPAYVSAQPNPVNSLPCDVCAQAVLILAGILLGNKPEADPCKPTYRR